MSETPCLIEKKREEQHERQNRTDLSKYKQENFHLVLLSSVPHLLLHSWQSKSTKPSTKSAAIYTAYDSKLVGLTHVLPKIKTVVSVLHEVFVKEEKHQKRKEVVQSSSHFVFEVNLLKQ